MPEILEIEIYRRSIGPIVGRSIARVEAPDPWYLKGGLEAPGLRGAVEGLGVSGLRRRGKLLLVDLEEPGAPGPSGIPGRPAAVLGLRFGMTGRPFLDDGAAPMTLEYGSAADRPEWDRFTIRFTGGGRLRLNDARRLGGVELDPDEDRLGPDAFTITLGQLRRALASGAPTKAVLLDQQRIAGLGNMLVDEVLYRAGLDPARSARDLSDTEVARLHRAVRAALPELLGRGGSHTGRLAVASRVRGATCPKDGAALVRRTIGGRTTFSCPVHQH